MVRFACCLLAGLLLAGCGPKLTPVFAQRELVQSAPLDRASVARVGQSLLNGLDMFVLAAYEPRSPAEVVPPSRMRLPPLAPGQRWIVCCRPDAESVLIEAPRSFAPKGVRLGLRVDGQGRVAGNRPWFDLSARTRLNQPDWTGHRLLFAPASPCAVDVFSFDLRYLGMEDGVGVIEYTDFKAAGARPPEAERMRLGPGSITIHGLTVLIVSIYPDHIRYVVGPER